MDIKEVISRAHSTAIDHGWWDKEREFPEAIALMHSELSEALEAYRDGQMAYYMVEGKPEGLVAELADVIIRIADVCGHNGWDLEKALSDKMAYNEGRPYRHGGKKC